MEYEIRSYEPGYIAKQFEIGSKIIAKWKYQTQSNKELMQQIYSGEDFDPDTRLYAFLDDKMVGFLPSKVVTEDDKTIGIMEFPIVLSEHEDDVAPLLIERAIEVLKEKGAELIRTRVSKHWGNSVDYAKSYDFEFAQNSLITASPELSQFDTDHFQAYDHIVEMDYKDETHRKAFAESFGKRFPMRYEGEIDEWIDYYKGLNKVTQLLLFDNDQVRGHLVAILRDGQEDKPVVTAYYAQGENEGQKMSELMETLLNKLNEKDFDTFTIALGGPQVEHKSNLEDLGIKFDAQVSLYEKRLQ